MQKYHDEPKQYKGYLKSALACGCVGTKSFVKEEKPVFWINLGCGGGGADHQPGARRILESDDEVEV